MLMVQLACAARTFPQVLVCLKSPELRPAICSPTLSAFLGAKLVKTTLKGLLVVPTA